MSGQGTAGSRSELAEAQGWRRAVRGAPSRPKSEAALPGKQGSLPPADPASGASPAELRPLTLHPHACSEGHTSRDLTRPQWNLRTWR